jgi:putative flippase GtrA
MLTFLKSQIASITATAVDFVVTIVLVEIFKFSYIYATIAGTASGGLTYFLMGRRWVFDARDGDINTQLIKYLLVWIVYLLISTISVFIITHYFKVNYILSKVLVSVLMSITYNYVLNKKFVFK